MLTKTALGILVDSFVRVYITENTPKYFPIAIREQLSSQSNAFEFEYLHDSRVFIWK